jgi:hypothetical protein
MKKTILLLLTCLFTMFLASSLYAQTDYASTLNLKYNLTKENDLELNWNNISDKYVIYKNEEKIWEGQSTSFSTNQLEQDYSYTFTIIAYKDGKEYQMAEVKIHTYSLPDSTLKGQTDEDSSSNKESPLKNTYLNAIISNNEVVLELSGEIPDDDKKYEIYKDGNLIGKLEDNKYVDKDITPGKTYTYNIVGKTEISESEKSKIDAFLSEKGIVVSENEKKEMYQKPYEITRVITIPDSISGRLKKITELSASSYQYTYVFRYKTFIPLCRVPALSMWQGWLLDYDFGGDCRGFDFDSDKYRTKVETPIYFTDGHTILDTNGRFVSPSSIYDSNGNLIETRQADRDGIKYKNISLSADKVSFTLDHGVAVPFGLAPEINYTYDLEIYKNGSFVIEGERDQAPSHELYAYMPNTDAPILTLIQGEHKGFDYLFPPYPNATFKKQY